jgi:hypothetical protein
MSENAKYIGLFDFVDAAIEELKKRERGVLDDPDFPGESYCFEIPKGSCTHSQLQTAINFLTLLFNHYVTSASPEIYRAYLRKDDPYDLFYFQCPQSLESHVSPMEDMVASWKRLLTEKNFHGLSIGPNDVVLGPFLSGTQEMFSVLISFLEKFSGIDISKILLEAKRNGQEFIIAPRDQYAALFQYETEFKPVAPSAPRSGPGGTGGASYDIQ